MITIVRVIETSFRIPEVRRELFLAVGRGRRAFLTIGEVFANRTQSIRRHVSGCVLDEPAAEIIVSRGLRRHQLRQRVTSSGLILTQVVGACGMVRLRGRFQNAGRRRPRTPANSADIVWPPKDALSSDTSGGRCPGFLLAPGFSFHWQIAFWRRTPLDVPHVPRYQSAFCR